MKWLTRVKPEKNACPASALFQCSLIRSDAADAAAADHKATPPPPMKIARRAAAAGHKTTQRRRRPPVRRRTALVSECIISFRLFMLAYFYIFHPCYLLPHFQSPRALGHKCLLWDFRLSTFVPTTPMLDVINWLFAFLHDSDGIHRIMFTLL